ncbi:nonribosomal peptide synthetase-like protein [Clohesyomyces aquaticus]|uniref:Nonribosomal peptide synthetase-like protein n=1 Tax=Clohesyomyces aquaticus TaxID=1231657 RepID=A0A1Y1ZCV9_9PLEO|nr:nonribosomal peptide synthetase-like protein [Clohesyomyces aquaticus]
MRLREDDVPAASRSKRQKFHSDRQWPEEGRIWKNEVSIPLPESTNRATALEAVLAAWVLLLYRYRGDSSPEFAWGPEGDDSTVREIFEANEIAHLKALYDVQESVRIQISKKRALRNHSSLVLVLADGPKDDSHFSVSIHFHAQQLHLRSHWTPPVMSEYQAESELMSFSTIIATVLRDPNTPIPQLVNTTATELEQIWKWNTPVPAHINRCLHDIIQDQCRSVPDKVAADSWDGTLTYAQVDRYSDELARNLLLLTNSPRSIIPLLFEKSRWTVVALLAVMKAGAAFALLDPAQPEGRLRTIVEQTSAELMITSESQAILASRITSATIVPISASKFSKLYQPFASQQPPTSLPAIPPSAPLYIQFTSGSTGKPKGVVISHSNYTSGAIPRADAVGYRSHSRCLDFASYAFDVSIDCMLCTLANGGTLCTPSDEKRINDLSGAIRDMQVNMAHMTPSVARVLGPDILPSLEILGLGGESVSASDAAHWGTKTKVVIAYGPSECTVGCTINNNVGGKQYTTIGKGVGASTWIVDPQNHDRLVPVGAVGELLVEGPVVGIGYLNEPVKTKEVYIENPKFLLAGAGTIPGRKGRLYKTGDLVRYDPDGRGEIVFVGRGDQQVKLRGQRIELAEIEHNMRKHLPTGTEVTMEVVKPGGTGEPILMAFLSERESHTPVRQDDVFATPSRTLRDSLQKMSDRLAADLPAYMVPASYIPLQKMPSLVSCKTDRKRLREIGSSMSRKDLSRFSSTQSTRQVPSTDMEKTLARLWVAVLGEDSDFGVNESFFAVGGDSLRAMKLVAATRDSGIALTVADVMLHPTISAMAAKAKPMAKTSQTEVAPFSLIGKMWGEEDARKEAAELCRVDPLSIEDVYPCTPLQEGLMALSVKFTDAYIAQRVVQLSNIDEAHALWRAFRRASRDSPILRTRVVNIPRRGLFQVVTKKDDDARTSSDLDSYLAQDRESLMELGDPLVRFGIVDVPGKSTAYLVLTIHHALYDGWSMPLIVERVNRAYQGLPTNRPSLFKDFIKYFVGLDRTELETYWKRRLECASPNQFPALPHSGYQARADSLLEHYITGSALKSGHTLATIIRGAWALTVSMYLGHSDIIFGETLTGRSVPISGIEEIEGPMITTIPLRIQVGAEVTVSRYLDQIHRDSVQQIQYEHFGLQHIRRLSPEARDACDLRTGIVLHPRTEGAQIEGESFSNLPASGLVPPNDEEAAKEALKFNTYALMLVCTLDARGFLVMASFDSRTVASGVLERMLRFFERVVGTMCKSPEDTLANVATLTAEEEHDALAIRPKGTPTQHSVGKNATKTRGIGIRHLKQHNEKFTPSEERLRILWSNILGIPEADISSSDSFFELGGDSIGCMRLVSEARLVNLNLTVAKIFQYRTLSPLAQIAEQSDSKAAPTIADVPFAALGETKTFFTPDTIRGLLENPAWGIENIYPARPLQEIAVNATVELPRYSVRYELIYMDGPIDTPRLFDACQKLMDHNEILRTVFLQISARCLGVVLERLECPTKEIAIPDGQDINDYTVKFCNDDIKRPEPHGTSFVAFNFLTSTSGASCLVFRVSHAQYDEICLPLLLHQLSALYAGGNIPKTEPFSKHINHVYLEKMQHSVPYWQNLLKDSSITILKPTTPLTTRNPTSMHRDFDISQRSKDITIATLPTAAWALCLARRLSTADIVFGEVVSGRNLDIPSADKIIGPCWQYIPVRIKFQPSWTYLDLLDAVQDQHVASSPHEGIGLSEIIEKCTDWDPKEVTWFDSVVHQATTGVETLDFGGVEARFETVYPHAETLREWKIQAFVEGSVMRIEIVTFEEWRGLAEGLLRDLEGIFEEFMGRCGEQIGLGGGEV